MGSVVPLQLAALGEGLGAGQAVEDPGLLGAGGGARLVHPLVFLSTDTSVCVSAAFPPLAAMRLQSEPSFPLAPERIVCISSRAAAAQEQRGHALSFTRYLSYGTGTRGNTRKKKEELALVANQS